MKVKVDLTSGKRLFTYQAYKDYIIDLFEQGLSTGDLQTAGRMAATKINLQRIKRIDRTVVLDTKLLELLQKLSVSLDFYLITEGWCGDSAQTTSFIQKIAEASDKINLFLLLRDENEHIMDAYLTHGAKAIPKLIIVDKKSGEELATWGPRPLAIQQMADAYKKAHPAYEKDEFDKNLHTWYAKDKGRAIQEDFTRILTEIIQVTS